MNLSMFRLPLSPHTDLVGTNSHTKEAVSPWQSADG